ncbi:glucose PTS transporter subunit IIA [Microbacterium trichothecenolyticum]|uniref:PTS system sucrose-specific IIC component n=1 Tax=Microbacterium trichothecenolyticum TaxID=69370 RepID=A0ABU0TUU3_MICTR|nr:glucose PTS transporter subunit IIA [Microbacterium trichothecenolyticum]MDQ1123270.1 PTS system sucrose-specific IIC component [Microbacterium trichothecenolyticum]
MNATRLADLIEDAMGGQDNLESLTHCATRVRLIPRNLDLVRFDALRSIPLVIDTRLVAGQVQVVLGPDRAQAVAAAMRRHRGTADTVVPRGRRHHPTRALVLLVDVFTPLLPVFVAGGLLMALHNLLASPDIVGEMPIVHAAPWLDGFTSLVGLLGYAVFALLPVLLGFAATERFGGSPHLGAAMGAALVAAPLFSDAGSPAAHFAPSPAWMIGDLNVFGVDYRNTVIPMIAIAFVLARVERVLKRRLHGSVQLLLVPTVTLLATGLIAFLVLGPALRVLGAVAAHVMQWLYVSAGPAGGAMIGAAYSPLVVTGLHQGLLAIELGLIATGGSFIFPIAATANIAQAAATFAVWACSPRGSHLRSLAATTAAPAALGIAEPAMFGVTLRLRAPFAIAVGATAVAAALLATFQVEAVTLGAAGLFGFASIAAGKVGPFIVCQAVAAGLSFGGTWAWSRWWSQPESEPGADGSARDAGATTISSPVSGVMVDVETLADAAFAASALGPTVAVAPQESRIVAPAQGIVTVVSRTGHAYGITMPDGTEVLVHVGIDTVRMNGVGFLPLTRVGARVSVGDPLVDVDVDAVVSAGLDPVVLTIVTNVDSGALLPRRRGGSVRAGDLILSPPPPPPRRRGAGRGPRRRPRSPRLINRLTTRREVANFA